jgi:phage-related protein
MKKYIAYRGAKFLIEWYFNSKGNSQAKEYFLDLDEDQQDKLLHLFLMMGNQGQIKNTTKFNYEGDGLYAFKPKPDRFLCFFFEGGKLIVTNAFEKKQQKLPSNEKAKAMSAKDDYLKRVKEGSYYDEE